MSFQLAPTFGEALLVASAPRPIKPPPPADFDRIKRGVKTALRKLFPDGRYEQWVIAALDTASVATSRKRGGRPRSVTEDRAREARQLYEQLGSWPKATDAYNGRHGTKHSPETIQSWKRYLKRRDDKP